MVGCCDLLGTSMHQFQKYRRLGIFQLQMCGHGDQKWFCAPPQTRFWTAYYFYIRRAPHTLICLPYLLEEFSLEFRKPKALFFKLMNGKKCETKNALTD